MMISLLNKPSSISDVISALSKTLRIPTARFFNETSMEDLNIKDDLFMANIKNLDKRNLKVNIVIAPNATNDDPSPISYCK